MSIQLKRDFRLWDFNVSHDQLLFRSPKTTLIKDNVDIVFWGVKYIDAPTWLSGVDLECSTKEDVARIAGILAENVAPQRIHCLVSSGKRYLIVASGFKVLSNELDIFESSLEYFRPDNSPLNRGRELYRSMRLVDPESSVG